MLQNFNDLKQQLSELSEIINNFNSEAVQLRIVELVFGIEEAGVEENKRDTQTTAKTRRRRKRTQNSSRSEAMATSEAEPNSPKSRKTGSAKGAVGILNELVEGDFFKSNKTINDIVSYCDQSLARRFKASAFSGALARMTRNGVLERQKNADGQYEYLKK